MTSRRAGLLAPLFSIPSRRSWGIGEIPDLVPFGAWLSHAGLDFVQVLPLNEMDHAHNSPYAALSAMAFEPLFIAVHEIQEFDAAGGEAALDAEAREALRVARSADRVDYAAVRCAKTAGLRLAFDGFEAAQPGSSDHRDRFEEFAAREAWWLDDYTLFRALHDEHEGRYWREWEEAFRDRWPDRLRDARDRLARATRYYAFVQWIAQEQWRGARRACGVKVFGDFPFVVSGHSADVWSRQEDFRLDASVGAPPDAGSPDGQDWGLPAYRWDVCAAGGYTWLQQRAARCASLFDGFRLDHLVGFYRTYVRERGGTACFVPSGEADQRRQGEAILDVLRREKADMFAEDLGTVPDFVRESMAALRVPGLKVLRWERHWDEPQQPFRDPGRYPETSVATTGTHDTETLAGWWDAAEEDERRLCAELPVMRAAGLDPNAPFSPAVRDALLRGLFASGSGTVLLPIQDVFGWRDRINDPTPGAHGNWTWRLPWPVDELLSVPEGLERAAFLRSIHR